MVASAFPGFRESNSALTTKWIRCGAVPLLFALILPKALHQVWIGVQQRSPSHSPLLQPPDPTLRSADEVWPEELQSLLGWGKGYTVRTVSCLLMGQIQYNSDTNPAKRKKNLYWVGIYSENILNLFLNLGESSSQPCNS